MWLHGHSTIKKNMLATIQDVKTTQRFKLNEECNLVDTNLIWTRTAYKQHRYTYHPTKPTDWQSGDITKITGLVKRLLVCSTLSYCTGVLRWVLVLC